MQLALLLVLVVLIAPWVLPRFKVDTSYLYLAAGGDGRMEVFVGRSAPYGRPFSNDAIENSVMSELIQHGGGTPAELVARLKENGQEFTVAQVEAAIAGWQNRGWVGVTDGAAHITQALYEYIK
ncbi:MAG: hypothetical protein K1X57_08655 [Gemmataceae bacterium]|nr:hypothetical protein [Gemmataceae bacterium]